MIGEAQDRADRDQEQRGAEAHDGSLRTSISSSPSAQDAVQRAVQRGPVDDLAAQDRRGGRGLGAQAETVGVLQGHRPADADLEDHRSSSQCTVTAHSTSRLQPIAMHDHTGYAPIDRKLKSTPHRRPRGP